MRKGQSGVRTSNFVSYSIHHHWLEDDLAQGWTVPTNALPAHEPAAVALVDAFWGIRNRVV